MSRKKIKKAKKITLPNPIAQNSAVSSPINLNALNSLETALRISDYDLYTCQTDLSTLGAYDNVKIDCLSLHRYLLTFLFKTYGVLGKIVSLPAQDAYRNGGFDLEADTINANELKELERVIKKTVPLVIKGRKWSRLFGGAAIIALDGRPLEEPILKENLQGKYLRFVVVDRWQMNYSLGNVNERGGIWTISDYGENFGDKQNSIFQVDDSRVFIFHGIEAPFIVENMLQGWGMSVYEQIFKQMNMCFKGQNVLFELLDEAKIDIVKLATMSEALMSSHGERALEKTMDIMARTQNYKSKLLMSTNDDYVQKQISFSGLEGISKEIRIMISGAADIPVNKLWGEGVTGFGSGEDSLENYNAMIENSIRTPDTEIWEWIIELISYNLFGRYDGDIELTWKPLRVLSSIDQQNIEDHKFANLLQLYDRKLLTPQELMEALKSQKLFIQETKALKGEMEDVALYNQFGGENITELKDITV